MNFMPDKPVARSSAVEDYLEQILDLINTKGYARVADIAHSDGLGYFQVETARIHSSLPKDLPYLGSKVRLSKLLGGDVYGDPQRSEPRAHPPLTIQRRAANDPIAYFGHEARSFEYRKKARR